MQYVLLKTVYHKDRAKYQALYEKRFQGEETVHLPITIGESPAFYCITGELLDIVYDIAMLNTCIFQIDAELPPIARDQFISSCLINEVAMTNRIEGIHSSRKEIGELLEGIRGMKNEGYFAGTDPHCAVSLFIWLYPPLLQRKWSCKSFYQQRPACSGINALYMLSAIPNHKKQYQEILRFLSVLQPPFE